MDKSQTLTQNVEMRNTKYIFSKPEKTKKRGKMFQYRPEG